ncbi:MAG: hypothetical protein ACE5OZ_25085 [Candidatus Heimdallarchaeota archaeon]
MLSIQKVVIPHVILERTFQFFQRFGNEYLEAFALWVGEEKEKRFEIKEVWFPEQRNGCITYDIPSTEVHRINVKLNREKYSAIAQLHTHPGAAFHSSVDDEFAILAIPGSLSIVIPDFGFLSSTKDLDQWVVYKLIDNSWIAQSETEVRGLFQII